jgi:putative endonuclease
MTDYYIYILRCSDNSYYVGFTTDIEARLKKQKGGHGSKHAKEHAAEQVMYSEKYDNKYEALHRESQLKRWSRAKKEALIAGNIRELKRLSMRRKK